MKACNNCGVEKAFDQFYSAVRTNGSVSYSTRCKPCFSKMQRTCVVCSIKFEGSAHAKLCSPECKAKHRPATFKYCAHCNKKFGPVSRLSAKFCSSQCKVENQKGKALKSLGVKRPHTNRARVGNCLTCGGVFRAVGDYNHKKQVYCSYDCYVKNRRVSMFEISVGEALKSKGVALTSQVRIGRWLVDFIVDGMMVAIEADGSYWHSSERVKERDARKTADLQARGYELFRIDELEFYKDKELAIKPVIGYIKNEALA